MISEAVIHKKQRNVKKFSLNSLLSLPAGSEGVYMRKGKASFGLWLIKDPIIISIISLEFVVFILQAKHVCHLVQVK